MQPYGNAGGFRTGANGLTAFRCEGDKRLRTRIQPEIDVVEPMGCGPEQSVLDRFHDDNIKPYTIDNLHVASSSPAVRYSYAAPRTDPAHTRRGPQVGADGSNTPLRTHGGTIRQAGASRSSPVESASDGLA